MHTRVQKKIVRTAMSFIDSSCHVHRQNREISSAPVVHSQLRACSKTVQKKKREKTEEEEEASIIASRKDMERFPFSRNARRKRACHITYKSILLLRATR